MKKSKTPFDNLVLDEDEQEIEDNLEQWLALSPKKAKVEAKILRTAALNSLKKDERITIRVFSNDLANLKYMAMEQGLKYQSLVTSILHKYVTGKLKET